MRKVTGRTMLALGALVGAVAVPATISAAAGGSAPRATPSTTGLCATRATAPTYKHVIVIIEENHSYGSIVGSSSAPYLNRVIASCGVASNVHNVTHNSLPNYLALVGGVPLSQLGPFLNDCAPGSCSHLLAGSNLFNQLSTRGAMSYEESMPTSCARSSSGNYAVKHNPAVYFSDLSAGCSTHDVALGSTSNSPLLRALSSERTAPAFSLVTPNLCNDMHDCGVGTGDAWLSTWLPRITSSTVYKAKDTAVFIVWDEGQGGYAGESCAANQSDSSCHVATIVVAPSVKKGAKVSTAFTTYSLLKTFEDLLGLPELNSATTAASMVKPFRL